MLTFRGTEYSSTKIDRVQSHPTKTCENQTIFLNFEVIDQPKELTQIFELGTCKR